MIQNIQFLLVHCLRSLSKTMPLLLFLCFVTLPNVGYGKQLSEEHIGFAKVSWQVGAATKKTAACVIVFSPQDKSVKEVFCRYQLGQTQFFMDDGNDRITVIEKNSANLSDAVLNKAKNQQAFLKVFTTFFNKKNPGDTLPAKMDAKAITTFLSNHDFPNGKLAGKKPTNVYVLELDNLADNTKYKTFAFFVHNLIHRRGTLKYTEEGIENLKNNQYNGAFKNLTHFEVRKLLTLKLGRLASKKGLEILQKDDVKAILLDKNAQELLRKNEIVKFLEQDNMAKVLANATVQSILSDEKARTILSDDKIVSLLNQGVLEPLTEPTAQAFLQNNQNQQYLESHLWLFKFAVFVGSKLELLVIIFATIAILLVQWWFYHKTHKSLSNLEANSKIMQTLSSLEKELDEKFDEKSGITAVEYFLKALSDHRPELENMQLAKLSTLLDGVANQLKDQQKTLVLLPPANSLFSKTILSSKQERISKIKEQYASEKGKAPVDNILISLNMLVRQEFQSEANMWAYLLQEADGKWLDNLLSVLEQYFSTQQELGGIKKTQKELQTQLSARFRFPTNDNMDFVQWVNSLLKQEGTWILVPPQFKNELLSHRKTIVSQIVSQINKMGQKSEDKHVTKLLRTDEEISQSWDQLLKSQSHEEMWKHLHEVSDKWLKDLLTVLRQYLFIKAEINKLSILLSTRFRLFQPQDKMFPEWTDELLENKEGTWLWLKPDFIDKVLSPEKRKTIQKIRNDMAAGNEEEPVLQLLCVDEFSKGWNTFLNDSFQSNEQMEMYLHKVSDKWLTVLLTVLEP
jgi:hypothetical protein